MAIITCTALYLSSKARAISSNSSASTSQSSSTTESSSSSPSLPHQRSQCIGEYVMAIVLILGLMALYVQSVGGLVGKDFANWGFNTNLAIVAVFGALEGLTLLAFLLKALKCDQEQYEENAT